MANLRPPVLDDYGLVEALRWYGAQLAARVSFTITVEGQVDPVVEVRELEVVLVVTLEAGAAQTLGVLVRMADRAFLTEAEIGLTAGEPSELGQCEFLAGPVAVLALASGPPRA